MTAVDTNVLVRLLTGDDAGQTAAARALFEAGPIWITKTVLLETEWVLRSLYGFDESSVLGALIKLLALKNVHIEDHPPVTAAISLASAGMDLADAMHVTSKPPSSMLATFDRRLVRAAKRAGTSGVAEVPSKR